MGRPKILWAFTDACFLWSISCNQMIINKEFGYFFNIQENLLKRKINLIIVETLINKFFYTHQIYSLTIKFITNGN